MLTENEKKFVVNCQGESINNPDIPGKKIKKKPQFENPFISGVSIALTSGITDIAVKKKIKSLTFILGCAKRMW